MLNRTGRVESIDFSQKPKLLNRVTSMIKTRVKVKMIQFYKIRINQIIVNTEVNYILEKL